MYRLHSLRALSKYMQNFFLERTNIVYNALQEMQSVLFYSCNIQEMWNTGAYVIHSQTVWEQKYWMLHKEDDIEVMAEKEQNLQKTHNFRKKCEYNRTMK
jgi:hypothetical protein